MNRKVIITCALTGAGDTVGRSEHVPVTPEQIAESGIAAARAGAAVVHVHVRDPQTGQGSRDVALYREAVERIRDSGVDVIINTTAGMGGDLMLDPQQPTTFVEGTDLVNGVERLAHVEEVMPDICTLDCGSLNFGEGSLVYVEHARHAARRRQAHPGARRARRDGDLRHRPPVVRQAARRGGPDRRARRCSSSAWTSRTARRPTRPCWPRWSTSCPRARVWASFALGRMQMPWVAQSVLLGGHVRVGLEDNLYLSKGVKATNAQLVERAETIIEAMGASVATPDEAREILNLKPRA